jgi:6-phosphogluconate dehydrogenase (decarboxylating)
MVHNGIEYGDMQLCAEACVELPPPHPYCCNSVRSYFLLKHIGRFDNQQIHESFTKYALELSCVTLAAGV